MVMPLALPALRFAVEDRGGRQVLERLSRGVRDLRPAWAEIVGLFKAEQKALFESGGAEAGGWAALSPRYARWKARHYPGQRILRRTGILEAAATGSSSEFIVAAQPLVLIARITTYYASWVDRRRELSPLTAAREQAWLGALEAHLRRSAGSAGAP